MDPRDELVGVVGLDVEQVPGRPGDLVDVADARPALVLHELTIRTAVADALDVLHIRSLLERAEELECGLLSFAQHDVVERRLLHRELGNRREVLPTADDRLVRVARLQLAEELAVDRPGVRPHARQRRTTDS